VYGIERGKGGGGGGFECGKGDRMASHSRRKKDKAFFPSEGGKKERGGVSSLFQGRFLIAHVRRGMRSLCRGRDPLENHLCANRRRVENLGEGGD